MAIDHRMVHFRDDDRSEVVGELERLAGIDDGSEWLTLSPWVDPEHLPVTSLLRRMFSGRGSKVPEVTLVPAQAGEPAQLGVLHSTGPGAVERLRELGVEVPETWHKIGDHSKRGLLFAVDPATPPARTLEFAVEAARALSGVPTDDRWVAQISTAR